jgi:outer membrane protein assembly factor BamB
LLALVARGADPERSDPEWSDHELVCVEPDLSGVSWRHGTGSDGEFGTFEPLLVRDQVVVGVEGKLLGLSRDDGSLRWSRPVRGLPRGLGSSPSMLYVGTLDGRVLALPWALEKPGS